MHLTSHNTYIFRITTFWGNMHLGYARLAASIIRSGIVEGDKGFIGSAWYNDLCCMVSIATNYINNKTGGVHVEGDKTCG